MSDMIITLVLYIAVDDAMLTSSDTLRGVLLINLFRYSPPPFFVFCASRISAGECSIRRRR